MTAPVRSARRWIQSEHADVITAIDRCADGVATSWADGRATDRRAIVDPLAEALDETGVLQRLPRVLEGAVAEIGHELPATPVPAPPYVVVTSRGPVLRATVEIGRLVVRFDAFAVDPGTEPCYRRLDGVELVVALE